MEQKYTEVFYTTALRTLVLGKKYYHPSLLCSIHYAAAYLHFMFQSPLTQPGSIEEGSFKDSYFCFSFSVLQTT